LCAVAITASRSCRTMLTALNSCVVSETPAGRPIGKFMHSPCSAIIEPNIVASYDGPAVAERNRRTAEELLAAALHAVGLSGCDLSKLHKNDARKQVVAWLLRKHTTVRNRWLSVQLAMGHETRISQSVRAVAKAEDSDLLRLRQTLEKTLKI